MYSPPGGLTYLLDENRFFVCNISGIASRVRRDIRFEANISEYLFASKRIKQVLFACFASKQIGGFAKRIKTIFVFKRIFSKRTEYYEA